MHLCHKVQFFLSAGFNSFKTTGCTNIKRRAIENLSWVSIMRGMRRDDDNFFV